MKKVVRYVILIAIVLVVAFLAAWPKLQQMEKEEKGTPAASSQEAEALPVEVAVVKPQPFKNKLQLTGSVRANETLELKSEVPGIIQQINFKEGESIRKGQVLFTIRNEELLAQLQKARSQLKLTTEMEDRQRKLLEREAVSQEEYDMAINELEASKADISLLQAQIAKTRVVAPFNGVVGLRQVSEGSYVAPGASIASLYELDPAKIDFSVPGRYAGMIEEGDTISFTTDGSDQTYEGYIYALEPQVDPATRSLQMRAISPNPDHSLLPGQFARIELTLQSLDNALMVPTQSIVPELNGHKVFVLRDGAVQEAKVQIGVRTENAVQVLNGLSAGDSVLTTGILQVRPGMDVQVTSVYGQQQETIQAL
jgi:membrane fusion protein (multidrug efflux system)